MLVSIIIPIYNVASYIERCLLSVLNQTYKDLEIILINDCTPDNSMNVVSAILDNHPRLDQVMILNHEINKGLSGARNTGVNSAKGDYVYFLDSDDYITRDCISTLVESAKRYNSEMVVGDIHVDGTGSFNKWFDFSEIPEYIDSNLVIKEYYYKWKLYMMAWNKLTKRSFILQNKLFFYEGIIHEDDHWSFFVFRKLQSLSIVNAETYIYCLRGDSIMNSLNRQKTIQDKIIICNLFIDELLRNQKALIDIDFVISYLYTICCTMISYKDISRLCDIDLSKKLVLSIFLFDLSFKVKLKAVLILLLKQICNLFSCFKLNK